MTSTSTGPNPIGGRRTRVAGVAGAVSRVSRGGLTDVPVVARLFSEARCFRAELARLARAQGLLLTHAAFEKGSFWLQHDDGTPTRAAAAIPVAPGTLPRPVMSVILRSFEGPSLGGVQLAPVQDELLGALDAAAPRWVLCQSTPKGRNQPSSDSDLLTTAVQWAAGDADTLAVLAHSPMERDQAERLGFAEHRVPQQRRTWWLGLRKGQ